MCPRKDATKCPVHGIIIPRDEQGSPLTNLIKKEKKEIPEWKRLEKQIEKVYGPAIPSSSELVNLNKKSTKTRIEQRLKRKSTHQEDKLESEMKLRDRQAFRW